MVAIAVIFGLVVTAALYLVPSSRVGVCSGGVNVVDCKLSFGYPRVFMRVHDADAVFREPTQFERVALVEDFFIWSIVGLGLTWLISAGMHRRKT